MSGAARFLKLLSSRSSALLRLPRKSRLLSSILPLAVSINYTRPAIPFSSFCATQSENLHSQRNSVKDKSDADRGGEASASSPNWYHPWPEWAKFIYGVRQGGYFERAGRNSVDKDDDARGIVSADKFSSPEFFRAARACLEFGRDRDSILGYLSRRHIKVVVENGSAYLFRDEEKLRSRLKSFLGISDSNVVKLDKATLVDLMKFLLSHANIRPVSSGDGSHSSRQIVGSSVRNLLSELAKFSYSAGGSYSQSSMQNHYSDRHGQAPRPQTQRIEMKKGDWICPRCTFMNFARNVKCVDCEEARPMRQHANGEWQCPQCNFLNFGRNITCKKCDCKRPGEMTPSLAYPQSNRLNTRDTDSRLSANEEALRGSSFRDITNGTNISFNFSTNASDKDLYGDNDAKSHTNTGIGSSTRENSFESDDTTTKLHNGCCQSSFEISGVGMQYVKYSGKSANTPIDSTDYPSVYSHEEKATGRYSWSCKNLEGSAVKELDPLDMSEEGKAE